MKFLRFPNFTYQAFKMIVFLSMTEDDEQRFDEILQRLPGDFVLHLRFANENFLVRFQCVKDYLAKTFGVVEVKDIHERFYSRLNHIVIFREKFSFAFEKRKKVIKFIRHGEIFQLNFFISSTHSAAMLWSFEREDGPRGWSAACARSISPQPSDHRRFLSYRDREIRFGRAFSGNSKVLHCRLRETAEEFTFFHNHL